MIGEKLRIFEDFNLLSKMGIHVSKEVNTKTMLTLNDLRVKAAHPEEGKKPITKGEATKSYSIILQFLEMIGYETSDHNNMINTAKRDGNKETLSNLPKRDFIEFIGREDQLKKIRTLLMHKKIHVLSIDGIGGVGKSALALELGHRLVKENIFDAVIWLSAKKNILTTSGVVDIDTGLIQLEDLFDKILDIFDKKEFKKYATFDSKKGCVLELLSENHCLIIIDNLETIEDKNLIDFIIDINFPIESKVLITSRKRIGQIEKVEYLEKFSLEETKKYIESQLEYRNFKGPCSESAKRDIYNKTGGIPLAIKVLIPWIIEGKIGIGETFIKDIDKETNILQFCFKKVYKDFLNEMEKRLFCMIAVGPSEINDSALKFISGLSTENYLKSILTLQNYSLISSVDDGSDKEYDMLPLTKEFGQNMADMDFPNINNKINSKYLKYLKKIKSDSEFSKSAIAIDRAKEAKMLAAKGDIEGAKSLFKVARDYDEKSDFVYYLSAQFCREHNELAQAVSLIKKAIKLNNQIYYYWIEYSEIENKKGNFRKSESILEESIKKIENDSHLIHKLILLKSKLQKNKEALSLAENNLIKNPKNKEDYKTNTLFTIAISEANWRIAASFKDKGNINQARKILENSVEKIEDLSENNLIDGYDRRLKWQMKKAYHRLSNICTDDKTLQQKYFDKEIEWDPGSE